MGNNEDGQRGLGHNKVCLEPTIVQLIADKFIKKIQCHTTYCLACTDYNTIVFWGTRYGIPDAAENEAGSSTVSTSLNPQNDQFGNLGNSTAAFTNFLASVYKSELILEPIEILA